MARMKWLYSIKEKIKIAIALTFVFVLVLVTNIINSKHFTDIQESFTSVYEDRLLVENYIFNLSKELNNKRMKYHKTDEFTNVNTSKIDNKIDSLISEFLATKLIEEEAKVLASFVSGVDKLIAMEVKLKQTVTNDQPTKKALLNQLDLLDNHLSRLSEIQLEEGHRLMNDSNNIIAINYSYSRVEIIVLIIVGLVIQALIFASTSLKPKITQNQHLN